MNKACDKGLEFRGIKSLIYFRLQTEEAAAGAEHSYLPMRPCEPQPNPQFVLARILGAIHSTKISGNFGPKLNGSVRSNRKSFEKTGPPFQVVLFSRSDRSEFWLNGSRPLNTVKFRKKAPPCIGPSKYKPPKPVTQKTFR